MKIVMRSIVRIAAYFKSLIDDEMKMLDIFYGQTV
jgi:hypothetical protein